MKSRPSLVFATNNSHKLQEIREIIGSSIDILSLADIGCTDDIPETADTLSGNALQKARYVAEKFNVDCFADDTGLEVEALNGAPGVHTARYAPGAGHDTQANMRLLLENMNGVTNRAARFVTYIALIQGGTTTLFEGTCRGCITTSPQGEHGFGYDPVFQPEGSTLTFAQMSAEDKNNISHRGRATRQLIDKLRTSFNI